MFAVQSIPCGHTAGSMPRSIESDSIVPLSPVCPDYSKISSIQAASKLERVHSFALKMKKSAKISGKPSNPRKSAFY
jgi:hypothetical protein